MPRLEVRIPEGTTPGATILAQDPNGKSISIIVPLEKRPGEVLIVEYDDAVGYQPPSTQGGCTYSPFPQPSEKLMAPQQQSSTNSTATAVAYNSGQSFPLAQTIAQPVQTIQPGAIPSDGMQPFTLVYDGHGSYIQGYNVTTEKNFGIKSALICAVLAIVCLPAACIVPCFPCDEVVIGQTADGSVFRVDR